MCKRKGNSRWYRTWRPDALRAAHLATGQGGVAALHKGARAPRERCWSALWNIPLSRFAAECPAWHIVPCHARGHQPWLVHVASGQNACGLLIGGGRVSPSPCSERRVEQGVVLGMHGMGKAVKRPHGLFLATFAPFAKLLAGAYTQRFRRENHLGRVHSKAGIYSKIGDMQGHKR